MTNQRKIWWDRICPTLMRTERKGKLLQGEESAVQDTVEFKESREWCSRVERESGAAQRARRRQCYRESFTERRR